MFLQLFFKDLSEKQLAASKSDSVSLSPSLKLQEPTPPRRTGLPPLCRQWSAAVDGWELVNVVLIQSNQQANGHVL